MVNTSLCYLYRGGNVLLLHRVKKENDPNRDKWIGLGGRCEEGESPEECMLREVREESGLVPDTWRYRGIVTFVSDQCEGEYMHLFTGESSGGEMCDCDEGELCWVRKEKMRDLPQWEGDRIFLRLLEEETPFFSLKLVYRGDRLADAVLNGKRMELPSRRIGCEP